MQRELIAIMDDLMLPADANTSMRPRDQAILVAVVIVVLACFVISIYSGP